MEQWEDYAITEHGVESMASNTPLRNSRFNPAPLIQNLTSGLESAALPVHTHAMWKWVPEVQTIEKIIVGVTTCKYLPNVREFMDMSLSSRIEKLRNEVTRLID